MSIARTGTRRFRHESLANKAGINSPLRQLPRFVQASVVVCHRLPGATKRRDGRQVGRVEQVIAAPKGGGALDASAQAFGGCAHRHRQFHRPARPAAWTKRIRAGVAPSLQLRQRQRAVRLGWLLGAAAYHGMPARPRRAYRATTTNPMSSCCRAPRTSSRSSSFRPLHAVSCEPDISRDRRAVRGHRVRPFSVRKLLDSRRQEWADQRVWNAASGDAPSDWRIRRRSPTGQSAARRGLAAVRDGRPLRQSDRLRVRARGRGRRKRRPNQLYLKQIRYVDFNDEDALARFLVSVTSSTKRRPDGFCSYRSAFEIRTTRRCSGSRFERMPTARPSSGRATWSTWTSVPTCRPAPPLPPQRGASLSQVIFTGHDGDHTEALPPLEFGYTRFEPAAARSRRRRRPSCRPSRWPTRTSSSSTCSATACPTSWR